MKRLIVAAVGAALMLPWSGRLAAAESAHAHIGAVSPTKLAIAKSAFSPGRVIKSFVDPNSNNTDDKIWPRDEHSKSYPALGRVNGLYMSAKWSVTPGKATVTFEYDGSVFKSPATATGGWNDGSTWDKKFSGTQVLTCPGGLGPHCSRLSAHFTDGSREVYDVFQH